MRRSAVAMSSYMFQFTTAATAPGGRGDFGPLFFLQEMHVSLSPLIIANYVVPQPQIPAGYCGQYRACTVLLVPTYTTRRRPLPYYDGVCGESRYL